MARGLEREARGGRRHAGPGSLTGDARGEPRGRDGGEVLLLLTALAAALAVALAAVGQVALAASHRAAVQAAADGAALAAAEVLRRGLRGSDARVWRCDDVAPQALREAAAAVASRNGTALTHLHRDGCDVAVAVTGTRRLLARGGTRRPSARAGNLSPPAAGGGAGVRASARARVSPGARPEAGPLVAVPAPRAPLARGTLLQALVAEADRIDRLRLPYVWGGGHQSSPAPPDGPFDCSGAVSRLLQAVGYPIPTMTSAQLTRIGRPGPGLVTIWAYDGHVFVTIAGRGWGTGARPHGGAGWLPYDRPYHGRFTARHLPELEDPAVRDLTGLRLGTALASSGADPPRVALVPAAR